MSSTWGNHIKISIFGESHGAGIGVVLDGLPAGERIDFDELAAQMARRAPGNDPTATARKEADQPEILSGLLNNVTTGAPLAALIRNTNTRSQDYQNLDLIPRPGHADYTAFLRYSGYNDIRGGGHFSGRLTAPLVFAGALCRQILARKGIVIGAHIASVGAAKDSPFDPVNVSPQQLLFLTDGRFPVVNPESESEIRAEIARAKASGDSIGGIVECAAIGLPAGLGDPMFDGLEGVISSIVFGIPAVKGIEFGDGFAVATMRGSENNDPYSLKGEQVKTDTNHSGGILGGISTGMPLVFRAAFKPTPSIARPQQSVNLMTGDPTELSVHGRHDPCIVPRAVPVVESALAIALAQFVL